MPMFRKKPVEIEASQWFKNGDHPLDYAKSQVGYEGDVLREWPASECKKHGWEGQLVRYFRHPEVAGTSECKHCSRQMNDHGWVETLEGGHIVCPGDWIITGVKGEHYPCKPDIFTATYDPA